VSVTANASDNVGVGRRAVQLDGANLGTEHTVRHMRRRGTPRRRPTRSLADAVARDAAGNVTTSSAGTVTVSNLECPGHELHATSGGGQTVHITGPFTGATAVQFNRASASFTVSSGHDDQAPSRRTTDR